MEINKIGNRIVEFIKKYRYVVLILIIGIAFMLIPESENREIIHETETVTEETSVGVTLSQELESILSHMDGVGSVRVMVSVSKGEQILYQSDTDREESGNSKSERIETVLITREDKSQTGLIARIDPPKYLGVLVLCQGAENSAVKLAIVDAVAKITGLGADCISVLKMK